MIFALNDERKNLADACKAIIYLPENAYLAAKWKLNNFHLSHIEIKRSIEKKIQY